MGVAVAGELEPLAVVADRPADDVHLAHAARHRGADGFERGKRVGQLVAQLDQQFRFAFGVVEHRELFGQIIRRLVDAGVRRRGERDVRGVYLRCFGLFAFNPAFFDQCFQAVDQPVDIVGRVVERHRSPGGAGDVQVVHQRHAAVMAGADGDAVGRQVLGDVQRRDRRVVDDEGDDGGFAVRRADDPQFWDVGEPLGRMREQRVLGRPDVCHADAGQVVDGGPQPDRAGDVRRAGLELVRQRCIRRGFERHRFDHVAAALVRRHGVEQIPPAPQHADAGGAVQLVATKDVKVTAEPFQVRRVMSDPLGPVDQHGCADVLRRRRDRFDIVDRAQRVADVLDRDHLHLRRDHLGQF